MKEGIDLQTQYVIKLNNPLEELFILRIFHQRSLKKQVQQLWLIVEILNFCVQV